MAASFSRSGMVPLDWLYPSGISRMASRSSPICESSRRLTGRIPLSLMSISTRFSHVDCIRSISNFSIFIAIFGDIQILYAQAGEIANRILAAVPPGSRFAKRADLQSAQRLLAGVLQFSQLLTLGDGIRQHQRRAPDDQWIELLLSRRVRSHCRY